VTAAGRRPTIYDVARACNVAPSTVSRAFSRPGRVSVETAERIRRVAEEIGYHLPPEKQQRPSGTSGMIAILVADLANPFFLDIVQGARAEASRHQHTVLVIDVQESPIDEREAVERVVPVVDGVILATSRMSESAIRMVAKQRPLVVLNRPMPDVPSAVTDNARGMELAVDHLVALGHRTLTYLSGPEASWADGMRWRSVRRAAADRGVRIRRLGPFSPTADGGAAAAVSFLDRPSSAVIAYNDLMAIGLMRALQLRGIRIPDDVSVVGFDDSLDARIVTPALTTVAVPHLALGRFAVQMLLGSSGVAQAGRPAMLPAGLVVRESTAEHVAARLRVAVGAGV
jgi:LacI family transcriptional regulator, repressor for deo operon, udp, cdd, tsx, nupC, and nupG